MCEDFHEQSEHTVSLDMSPGAESHVLLGSIFPIICVSLDKGRMSSCYDHVLQSLQPACYSYPGLPALLLQEAVTPSTAVCPLEDIPGFI